MKNETIIYIILGFALILFLFRKKVNTALNMTRGYRNNNPGNIRLTYDTKGNKTYWQGEVDGVDKSFKTFKNMYYGYRAIFVTLNSYFSKGVNTIEKIVNRYAPSSENDVEAYIKTLVAFTGKERNEGLLFSDNKTILKLVAAISFHENGVKADESQVTQGYKLYNTEA
jgi:hypothetical protein